MTPTQGLHWQCFFVYMVCQNYMNCMAVLNLCRLSKSSAVMSMARMLKTTSLCGFKNWKICSVLNTVGLIYRAIASLTCSHSVYKSSYGIYTCCPPGLPVVSSFTGEHSLNGLPVACVLEDQPSGCIGVNFNGIGLISDVLLKGFTLSLSTMSLHKKCSLILFLSTCMSAACNIAFMVMYIACQQDNTFMMAMINAVVSFYFMSLLCTVQIS